jgi:hypothetical protein
MNLKWWFWFNLLRCASFHMYENNDIEWCDYTNKIHDSYDIDYMNEMRSWGWGGSMFSTSCNFKANSNLQTTNQIKLTRENLWTPHCIFHDYPPNFVWSMVRYMNITFQLLRWNHSDGRRSFQDRHWLKKNCYVEM